MKIRRLAVVTLFIMSFPVAFAAQNGSTINTGPTAQRMNQRFERMQTMVSQARGTKNRAERRRLMRRHMGIMLKQMRIMRTATNPGNAHHDQARQQLSPKAMQERMNMMQRMMEQILEQQQMMMKR